MATIVDYQIRHLCRTTGLVEPFDVDLVNPASIDVRLGKQILVETETGWVEHDISKNKYQMSPGEFILGHTLELIRVPSNLECIFQLKSSRGREGYEHALAGYIDAGFIGQVTLELTNLNRYHFLPLKEGMRIGQLRFIKLDSTPLRPYCVTGRYQNNTGACVSLG
jgi:dCTP deaminase